MGREVRRVPKNWEHPKDENGNYIPLLPNFDTRLKNWEEENAMWQKGLRRNYVDDSYVEKTEDEINMPFEEWDGEKPVASNYMPVWAESEKTHIQMYENTTEGTPISPVMESPESLAKWLTDNNASAFGGMTATYEQWLNTCNRGWTVGMVLENG